MRKRLLTTLLLGATLGVAGCAPAAALSAAPDRSSADRQQIERVGQGLLNAERSRDLEATLSYYAPDAVVHAEGQPRVQGAEEIRTFYRTFFDQVPFSDFRVVPRALVIADSGDMAYDSGDNLLTINTPAGPQQITSKYLAVWRKLRGEWKIAALSITSDQPSR